MSARTKKYLSMYIWMIFLSVAAIYLDIISFRNSSLELLIAIMSCTVYICVFAFWMMSIKWRCMHRRIRNYIMAIGAQLIFWMALTLLQNEFAVLPLIKRQLWYCSYIPIVFVPLMEACAASYVFQPDTQPLGRKYRLLWIPSVIFSLLIMTNELHDLVFDVTLFETHDMITDHSIFCWILFCWAVFLDFVALTTLIAKSRILAIHWTRIAVPLILFLFYIVYMVLFFAGIIGENRIAMPIVNSFFHLTICESCLFLRLFPTNFYYRQSFENADIGMQLLDANDTVRFRSHKARILSEEEKQLLKEHGKLFVDGFEIYRERVQGGFFVYEKDVRRIHQKIEQLKMAAIELEDTNNYIAEQQRLVIRNYRLDEKERIYNEVSHIITPSLDKIDRMLADIKHLDGEEQRRMMWRINLLGTYVKRRANLELRRKESPAIFGSEVSQCLAEFAVSLHAIGISSSCFAEPDIAVSPDSAILLLNIYADIIEEQYENLKNISVIESHENDRVRFLIEALGRNDMAVTDDKIHLFSDFAEKHGMKMIFEAGDPSTTVSFTIISEDGGYKR